MKVKKFNLVFGILFLFLMLISFASALTEIPIDAYWGQSSLTYNSGTTYYVGVYADITEYTAFMNNYNGEDYCIDIVEGANEFGADCDLLGTISSTTTARSWSVPSSAINKTLTFKFKIPSRGEEASSGPLTVLQGTTSGLDLEGDCTLDSQCGTDGYSADYCSVTGNVVKNFIDYFCSSGTCSSSTSVTPVATCSCGCLNAACISSCSGTTCETDEDCGFPFDSANYCLGNNVYKNRTTYSCNVICSNSTSPVLVQTCASTCSTGACVGAALPPNFDNAAANWWDLTGYLKDYTNNLNDYPIILPNEDSKSGKIIISGIANANGQSARIDILKLGVSIGQGTFTIANGIATGTWSISRAQIDPITNWSTFTSKITLLNETYPLTSTLPQWMKVLLQTESIVCDLTTPTPSLSWGSSSASIQTGASYTATMSASNINAISGTTMSLKVYTNAGALVSSQTAAVSTSNTISATNTFSGLSPGTHYFRFTLTGCSSQTVVTSGMLTITVSEPLGCEYSIGDGVCCGDQGETCSNEAACGACEANFDSASAVWLKNGEVNVTDTILTGSINNIYRMQVSGIANAESRTLYFDVYEYDALGAHEVIQTDISSLVSGGEASASFSIDESFLANNINDNIPIINPEPPYKLYFKAKIGALVGDFVDNKLELNVADPVCGYSCGDGTCCGSAGEVQGGCILDCGDLPMDISGATGAWSADNLSFIEGLNGTRTLSISGITHVPAEGAQIIVHIIEQDNGDGEGYTDIETQTIYSVAVQPDGTASIAVTIGPTDISLAGGNENFNAYPDYSPYEFSAIISYGVTEKAFSEILEVYVESTVACLGINVCADYTDSGQCSDDFCNKADLSFEGNPLVNCSDPNVDCYCYWDESAETECNAGYNNTDPDLPPGVSSIGSCNYLEDRSGDNCDNGYLSYNWTASWVWGAGNNFTLAQYNQLSAADKLKYVLSEGFYRYDPERKSTQCVLGFNTIACPAQVQLSGFSWINLVIALIIVAIIYYLFVIEKRKKAKQKSSISKKKRK